MNNNDRYNEAKKITLIGALVNVLLGFIKLIGGVLFHSHALVADGVHSFSDLLTDAMVLVASKYGGPVADDLHPYGHQRIETIATFFLAMLLMVAGFGIAWQAFNEIVSHAETIPKLIALPIALISIIANEILFQYTRIVGTKIQSDLITANAWHHRSDALSSVVVSIGIIGSIIGYKFVDPLAAIIVGFMVVKTGVSYAWNSSKELVDTGVSPEKIAQIKEIIMQVDGVKQIHQLRSRMMGPNVFIDVHILVSSYISVSEGHYIAQHVHETLMDKIDQIKDVTVHVDPEDDEFYAPSDKLPNRTTLENKLIIPWEKDFPEITYSVLHYLDGKTTIDLYTNDKFTRLEDLEKQVRHDLTKQPDVVTIRVLKVISSITKIQGHS